MSLGCFVELDPAREGSRGARGVVVARFRKKREKPREWGKEGRERRVVAVLGSTGRWPAVKGEGSVQRGRERESVRE